MMLDDAWWCWCWCLTMLMLMIDDEWWWLMMIDDAWWWLLMIDGWWLMMVDDDWWLMIDDWCLMIGDWWLMIGVSWSMMMMMVDGWWLMIDDWWSVGGDWWLMILDRWLRIDDWWCCQPPFHHRSMRTRRNFNRGRTVSNPLDTLLELVLQQWNSWNPSLAEHATSNFFSPSSPRKPAIEQLVTWTKIQYNCWSSLAFPTQWDVYKLDDFFVPGSSLL